MENYRMRQQAPKGKLYKLTSSYGDVCEHSVIRFFLQTSSNKRNKY